MARGKSFEEYREENLKMQEKVKQQMENERIKQLQAQHCIQRFENQVAYQRKKKDKARVHRLITKGAAIESICKDSQYLMESEFYELMEDVLNEPQLQFHLRVADLVQGRAEIAEEQERRLREKEE
jgi:predicted transcriptional regulator